MNRAGLITAAVSAVVVVGLGALAIPAFVATWTAAAPIVETAAEALVSPPPLAPVATESAEDVGPAAEAAWGPFGCTGTARIDQRGILTGDALVDNGAFEGANGSVIYGDEGSIRAYEVAPGDSMWAIGDRFCVFHVDVFYFNRLNLNTGPQPQPGRVLLLNPGA